MTNLQPAGLYDPMYALNTLTSKLTVCFQAHLQVHFQYTLRLSQFRITCDSDILRPMLQKKLCNDGKVGRSANSVEMQCNGSGIILYNKEVVGEIGMSDTRA